VHYLEDDSIPLSSTQPSGRKQRAGVSRTPVRYGGLQRRRVGGCARRVYVTTKDVRSEPALPHETRIGQRPDVVLVPTVHVQISVAGEEPVRMLMVLSNPTRATQMFEVMEQVFANGAPDPETAGPLLAQLEMEMIEPPV
jgi:hypothetical protein